jgi:glyceraldehyde-3-phosphate dehydrogenase (NADP+)
MEGREYQLFIGNQWVKGNEIQSVTSPYNGKEVGRVHFASQEQLQIALQMASDAYQKYRKSSTYERIRLLELLKQGIERKIDDFARIIALEGGKPIRFARNEVRRGLITIQSAIDVVRTWVGEVLPLDLAPQTQKHHGIWKRFPIGPILGITPFNFPLNLVLHKVAPALASGNTIIIKPSSQTPITSLMLAEIALEAELPPGVLNVVPASGGQVQPLVEDPGIKMISFTGSAETGWKLKSYSWKKKITLELGGNAAAIVAEDANLDFAVPRLALGAMAHAGQVCISVQRIYIHESIFNKFKTEFIKEIQNHVPVGDPMDENTVVGPIIDRKSLERIESWVSESVHQGAKILIGGKSSPPFYLPTVLTHTNPTMKVWKDEVFAPVVLIEPYSDIDEAIQLVNQSVYGLQAAIFTNTLEYVWKAYEEIEAGGVIVNDYPTFRIDPMPYGGVKESGFGREGLRYAMEEMTEIKLMVMRKNY